MESLHESIQDISAQLMCLGVWISHPIASCLSPTFYALMTSLWLVANPFTTAPSNIV